MEIKAANRKRILFVNDDADTTAVIKRGLTLQGFEVETFIDPKSALQNFKTGMYDLVVIGCTNERIRWF